MVALRAERVSATASFLGVGIVELKTTLLNAFVVVNGCSIKKQVAFLVNDNGNSTADEGSTVNISGGDISTIFTIEAGSDVSISGGVFGDSFTVLNRGSVDISGGTFDNRINLRGNGELNLSGGTVLGTLSHLSSDVINISGGEINGISGSGEVNLSGGLINGLVASRLGDLNIFGTEFFIDGDLVESLDIGETLNLRGQDLTLAGTLLDGSDFEIQFGSGVSSQSFANSVNLTLSTVVPEPSSLMLLIACFGLGTLKRRRPPATR